VKGLINEVISGRETVRTIYDVVQERFGTNLMRIVEEVQTDGLWPAAWNIGTWKGPRTQERSTLGSIPKREHLSNLLEYIVMEIRVLL
jgi:hypothetical protein